LSSVPNGLPAPGQYSTARDLSRLALKAYRNPTIRNIVNLKLGKLASRFDENHKSRFTWDEEVSALITARCTEVDSGARNIDYILTQSVLPVLSSQVLERISMMKPFAAVHMGVAADGSFTYDFTDQPLRAQA